MSSIRRNIQSLVSQAAGGVPADLSVPEREEFGHYSTNAAMRMAGRTVKSNPQKVTGTPIEIARELAAKIEKAAPKGFFEKVEVAPPGFANFWLSKETIQNELAEILKDEAHGSLELLRGKRIMVEYTDPNPFKQFHIGHLMTNVIGEAIARLHEAAGAEVVRVTWQGDVGMHVAMAVWAMRNKKAGELPSSDTPHAKIMEFLGACYAAGAEAYRGGDEAAKEEIEAINKKIYERADPEVNRLYDTGRAWSLEYFETMYARLGTKFVRYFFESEEGPKGLSLVKAHPEVFRESEGAVIFRGEDYGLHTRVFINAHGLPTYEAKELGLNQEKFSLFHPDLSIIVTGNEINEYFKVLTKAMELVLPDVAAKTKHIGHGMLRLPSGKMSSRTGNVITAESLIDEVKRAVEKKLEDREGLSAAEREEVKEGVALAAIRYSILRQGIGRDIVFDMEHSIAFHGDSGPYLQYTYARLQSILRKAQFTMYNVSSDSAQDLRQFTNTARHLETKNELALIRVLAEFPHAVRLAAETLAPNALALYCYGLANLANRFYEAEPILTDENAGRKAARLMLVETAARVLARGLEILGIKALEKI